MSAGPERREMIALPDGTYVEAWVGYRQWNMLVSSGAVRLHPISARSRRGTKRWEPGETQVAVCMCVNHARVQTCGFHAWAELPRLLLARPHAAWGECYLWGDVDIHENGYRAEFARVAALYVFDGMDERARRLIELAALQYDVPVVRPNRVTVPLPLGRGRGQ